MSLSSKFLAHSLIVFATFLILIQHASATTSNFLVKAGEVKTQTVNLAVEDRFIVKFSVVGRSENFIDFCIADPDGNVTEFGNVGNLNYPFICQKAGDYILRFSNVQSSEEKLVTLTMRFSTTFSGFPKCCFLR